MELYRLQRSRAQVPIVPLIDILFILLVFFIVSTTFKKPREILQIELPTVNEIPSDTVTETRCVIAVDSTGQVSLDALVVPDGLLDAYLNVYRKKNPGQKFELKADRRLALEKLLEIWDALGKAGIEIKDVPARIKVGGGE